MVPVLLGPWTQQPKRVNWIPLAKELSVISDECDRIVEGLCLPVPLLFAIVGAWFCKLGGLFLDER